MSNECKTYQDQIVLAVDTPLSTADDKALQAHLDQCNLCQSYSHAINLDEKHLDAHFIHSDEIIDRIKEHVLLEIEHLEVKPYVPFWQQAAESRIGSRLLQYAAVACIVVSITMTFNNAKPVNLKEVQTASAAQPWTHVRWDNGIEIWKNAIAQKRFIRYENGRVRYDDDKTNTHLVYIATPTKEIKQPGIYQVPESQIALVHDIFKNSPASALSEKDNQWQRIDTHTTDGDGKKNLIQQIWIDPATKLPVKIRRIATPQERMRLKRNFVTGFFLYPESGPEDLTEILNQLGYNLEN